MNRPGPTQGLRHIALFVTELAAAEYFFVDLMGMAVEWRPDPDNVYLTTGNDNLALHGVKGLEGRGQLDHIGFFIESPEAVDYWHTYKKISRKNWVMINQAAKYMLPLSLKIILKEARIRDESTIVA